MGRGSQQFGGVGSFPGSRRASDLDLRNADTADDTGSHNPGKHKKSGGCWYPLLSWQFHKADDAYSSRSNEEC